MDGQTDVRVVGAGLDGTAGSTMTSPEDGPPVRQPMIRWEPVSKDDSAADAVDIEARAGVTHWDTGTSGLGWCHCAPYSSVPL